RLSTRTTVTESAARHNPPAIFKRCISPRPIHPACVPRCWSLTHPPPTRFTFRHLAAPWPIFRDSPAAPPPASTSLTCPTASAPVFYQQTRWCSAASLAHRHGILMVHSLLSPLPPPTTWTSSPSGVMVRARAI